MTHPTPPPSLSQADGTRAAAAAAMAAAASAAAGAAAGKAARGTAGDNAWVPLGGQTVGIEPHLVGQLASALQKVPGPAGAISKAIGGICDRAAQAQQHATPAPASPQSANPFSRMSAFVGENAGALEAMVQLQAISQQVPPVAGEIKKRLDNFNACQRESIPGVAASIDKSFWFTDDPGKIEAAVQYFEDNVFNGPSQLFGGDGAAPAQAIYNNWTGNGGNEAHRLSGEELDAVLLYLATSKPGDLDQLNTVLGKSSSLVRTGPDTNLQQEFSTLILSHASQQTIEKVKHHLTNLQLDSDPKVDAALRVFEASMAHGNWQHVWDDAATAQAIYRYWEAGTGKQNGLNSKELDEVLNALTPDQLGALNATLGNSSTFPLSGPDTNLQEKFSAFVLSHASQQTIEKVKPYLSNLQLDPDPKVRAAIQVLEGNLTSVYGKVSPASAAQGIYESWSGTGKAGNEKTKLNPGELDTVLNSLTPNQLKKLNGELGGGVWPSPWPDTDLQQKFSAFIFKNATAGPIRRVLPYLTNLPELRAAALDAGYF